MADAAQRWCLYLDESGSFHGRGSDAQTRDVAGVLVREDSPDRLSAALWRALRRDLEGAPWPPHAWFLRRPGAWVAWANFAPERASPLALEHAEALASLAPEVFAACRAAFERGREPSDEQLRAIELLLRERPPYPYHHLRRHAFEAMERVFALAQWLSERDAWAFVSSDSARGEELPPQESPLTDGFLHMLSNVFRRVADALQQRGGTHEVRLYVMPRHVRDATLETDVSLTLRHVNEAATAALGPTRADGPVRLVPAAVHTLRDDLPAQYVLADVLANRARHAVHRSSAPLESVVGEIETIGFPARFDGTLDRVHLSATGAVERFLEARRRGEDGFLPEPPTVRRWAHEQGARWAAAGEGQG